MIPNLYYDDGRWSVAPLTYGRARIHENEQGRSW